MRYHRHSRWAVDRVNLQLYAGEFIGLIGESGSGKTSLAHAILGLLPATSRLDGQLLYKQQCLTTLGQNELTRLRGAELGYVPQQSMAALNPVRTIGAQVAELYQLRGGLSRPEAWRRAADILEQMQLIDVPRVDVMAFPFGYILRGQAQEGALIRFQDHARLAQAFMQLGEHILAQGVLGCQVNPAAVTEQSIDRVQGQGVAARVRLGRPAPQRFVAGRIHRGQ